jgi:3-oxoacyl-[acyl-carrier protein] reductase
MSETVDLPAPKAAVPRVLDKQVAIVTGASRGLGKATALALARMGATVVVNHKRNADMADEVCAEIAAEGGSAIPLQADVTDPAEVQAMMASVFKKFRRIDILINNAGITRDNYFVMMSPKEWDDVVDVNLNAVFHATKAAIRLMAGQRRGVVVNIGSGAGLVAMPGQVNYSAAKAALLGLTRTAARELGAKGVRVVNVAPGFFKTDMTETLTKDFIAETFRLTPLGRWGLSEELVALVTFLVTPAAAGFNGQTLVIDGGRGAWESEFGLA